MNTYFKYTANVFVAKCEEKHEKGETITLTTKHGKENDCIVFNFLGNKEGHFLYSIVRADGFNVQEYAKQKAERYQKWAKSAENKSNQYYEASQEGREFLSLGEPVKVGHHSEKRHRALIERNWNRMGKSVEESKKAEQHQSKSEYWEERAKTINLSMPESLEFYEFKLEEAKKKHQFLKDNPKERAHSYSLTYANNEVKEAEKNLKFAVRLWGTDEEIKQIFDEEQQKAEAKAVKSEKLQNLLNKVGYFFAFNTEQFKDGYAKLIQSEHLEEGEKVSHAGAGLYIPSKNIKEYLDNK